MALGRWNGDTFTADDGRSFSIFSEQCRGEPRFYEAKERVADGTGERGRGIGGRNWRSRHLPDRAAGFDKRTVRRAIERYVRETSEGSDG